MGSSLTIHGSREVCDRLTTLITRENKKWKADYNTPHYYSWTEDSPFSSCKLFQVSFSRWISAWWIVWCRSHLGCIRYCRFIFWCYYDAIRTGSTENTLLEQCSTKGNAVIAAVEQRLNKRKENLGAEFDEWCTDPLFCQMVRDLTIQSRENEIDREIGRMKAWYGLSIEKCVEHFNYAFSKLSPKRSVPISKIQFVILLLPFL